MLEVTQADRDAAADYVHLGSGTKVNDAVREGYAFTRLSEAFARHRIAERERCAQEASEEYVTVTLSKDGIVMTHNAFEADFDEMVRATQTIVDALQKRLSDRKFCPYSHGAEMRKSAPVKQSLTSEPDLHDAVTHRSAWLGMMDTAINIMACKGDTLDERQANVSYGLHEKRALMHLLDSLSAVLDPGAPVAEPDADDVERVARAICAENGEDPDDCRDGAPLWELYKGDARAAIAAMRPDPAMVLYDCSDDRCGGYGPWRILAKHDDSAWIMHDRDGRFVYRSVDLDSLTPAAHEKGGE
jgi:hypothetical protein